MVVLAGVVTVPCLVVEALPAVLLVAEVPVVREVPVPVVFAERLAPTTSLRPDVPVLTFLESEEVTVLLPLTDAAFEVFFIFPALTEFLVAVPLPVERLRR